MSTDLDWITSMIAEARKTGIAVPDPLWTQLAGLVKGTLSERQLSSGELTTIARALIATMSPAPPIVERHGEN